MFNFLARLLGNRLVQAVLVTALAVSSINVAFAAEEKPATIGELMQNIVEDQRAVNEDVGGITNMTRAHRNYVVCRRLLGPDGDCEQEYEAFIKAIDQE